MRDRQESIGYKVIGWQLGFIGGRDVGYGVPAVCEYPACNKKIDRGLSYACGGFPDSEYGCGRFFCGKHLHPTLVEGEEDSDYEEWRDCCERCKHNNELPEDAPHTLFQKPFDRKPDTKQWVRHKLKHPSWKQWRDENVDEVKKLESQLKIGSE